MSEQSETSATQLGQLALELTRTAGRFARVAGRAVNSPYSLIAWRVLAALEQQPMRVSDLALQERVAQPSMTGLVQRLGSEGWVIRTPDPSDGRATLLEVTAAGLQALNGYRNDAAARVRPHLSDLSAEDRQALLRATELMHRICAQITTD